MAGSIDYSLGLANRGFLGPLGIAQGALAAFTTFAVGAGGLLAGVFAQIERGGQLADLKARTGETVDGLFKLQEGFKIVGIESGKVPQIVFALQRALSGMSESGDSTAEAFAAIGLSMEGLRSLSAADQVATVAERLSRLSSSDAAGVASKIFGRGASGDILQLGRDFDSFRETLERVDNQAQTFARNAEAFDKLGDTIQALKTSGAGFFAEIAAGVTPAFQAVLDSLQGFDIEGLGKRIGNAFRAITKAFETGQVTELIGLSLAAGFERATDIFQRSLVAIFAAAPELINATFGAALKAVGLSLVQGITGPLASFLEAISNSKFLGVSPDSPVGRDGLKLASALRLIGAAAQEEAPKAMQDALTSFFKAARSGANAFGEGAPGEAEKRLRALLSSLVPADGALPGGGGGNGVGSAFSAGGAARGEAVDALTRIGFFSGAGGANEATQHARATAAATRESAKLLNQINNRMERNPAGFSNL